MGVRDVVVGKRDTSHLYKLLVIRFNLPEPRAREIANFISENLIEMGLKGRPTDPYINFASAIPSQPTNPNNIIDLRKR